MVPAFALVLAMLTAFPAFQDVRVAVQDFILGNFLPSTSLKISEELAGFIDKAGRAIAFGVIGLAATSIMLLLTIESAFNRIFRVRRMRPFYLWLLVLWAVVTVGPFLVGVSFTLIGVFGIPADVIGTDVARWAALIVGQVMPTVLSWVAMTFVYIIVPNRRISLVDAAIGAVAASFAFALLRAGFAAYIGTMSNYETIYGAAAAVPVFFDQGLFFLDR